MSSAKGKLTAALYQDFANITYNGSTPLGSIQLSFSFIHFSKACRIHLGMTHINCYCITAITAMVAYLEIILSP